MFVLTKGQGKDLEMHSRFVGGFGGGRFVWLFFQDTSLASFFLQRFMMLNLFYIIKYEKLGEWERVNLLNFNHV